jgi:hypothetical protein
MPHLLLINIAAFNGIPRSRGIPPARGIHQLAASRQAPGRQILLSRLSETVKEM